jgi:hypothetical protein
MKKLIITSSFILMLGLFSCKKEKVTLTQTSQEELVTGKPSPPPPPPPNILQWQKFMGAHYMTGENQFPKHLMVTVMSSQLLH